MRRIVEIAALSAALVLVFSFAGVGTARADGGTLDPQFYLEEHQKGADVTPIFSIKSIEKEARMGAQEYRVLKPEAGEWTREKLEEMARGAAGAGF